MAKNLDKLISEVFEKEKVFVHCEKHLYCADVNNPPRQQDCVNCWQAFYIALFALSNPERRAEQIDDLNAVGHIWAEQIERGQMPTVPNSRPQVDIKKEFN